MDPAVWMLYWCGSWSFMVLLWLLVLYAYEVLSGCSNGLDIVNQLNAWMEVLQVNPLWPLKQAWMFYTAHLYCWYDYK